MGFGGIVCHCDRLGDEWKYLSVMEEFGTPSSCSICRPFARGNMDDWSSFAAEAVMTSEGTIWVTDPELTMGSDER